MWLVVSFDNCYIKLANISLAITLSRDKINLISLYHEDTGRVTPIDLLYKDNSLNLVDPFWVRFATHCDSFSMISDIFPLLVLIIENFIFFQKANNNNNNKIKNTPPNTQTDAGTTYLY